MKMEGFQEDDRIMASPMEEEEIDEDMRQWSRNNSYQQNMQVKHDSLPENQESYNMYNSNGNNRQLESQDMFTQNNHNSMEQEDNGNFDVTDSNVVSGLYEMGKDCLEVEQDILQKCNDIQLLQENAKLLGAEIEEKQKLLETSKVELLTEQDNYDDIQKKLNDEIELITTIGLQQEALNNQTKNLFEQKFRVDQLLETFSTEFSAVKVNSEKILYMFEEKHRGLNTVLQTIANMKLEIDDKKTKVIEEKNSAEEKLKIKINEMKRMHENLKLKYYQQIAILDYLKVKGDEEWSRCAKLESELKLMQENEHKQIDVEKDAYTVLEEREKKINDELLELKEKVKIDNTHLDQLMQQKSHLHEQVGKLLQNEANYFQKCEDLNKSLLTITTEMQELKQILYTKEFVKEEEDKLNQCIEVLQLRKNDIFEKTNEASNSIMEANKICNDLELNIEDALKEQLTITEIKYNFASRKQSLLKEFEEMKEQNKTCIDNLEKEKSAYTSQQNILENQISELNSKIKSQSTSTDTKSSEILTMKQLLQDNCEKAQFLHNEIEKISKGMTVKQDQFEMDLSAYNDSLREKEIINADLETEIHRRLQLQSEIEYLKGELQSIDCQKRNELKTLNDKCQLELQVKQMELEKRKNELELTYKEKKRRVSDLQEDIVDEQKNELHLVKTIQKFTFIGDKNKRELLTLKNVTKTLDEKLSTIARAVTNSLKDKESTIQSQSTVISSGMPPPNTEKKTAKFSNYDDDSSSSGVSMHDNDTTWKKKLLKKQQMKQLNTQSSASSQRPTQDAKGPVTSVTARQKSIGPIKTTQAELQNKSTDKPLLKKYAGKSPAKKTKK